MKKDLILNKAAIIILRKMYERFGLKWLTKDTYSMSVFENKPQWDDGSWEAVTGTSCCLCAATYENYIQSFNLDTTPKEVSIRTVGIITEQPINLLPYIYPNESHGFYVGEEVRKPENKKPIKKTHPICMCKELKAYQNTGLTPEKIIELKQKLAFYEIAEK